MFAYNLYGMFAFYLDVHGLQMVGIAVRLPTRVRHGLRGPTVLIYGIFSCVFQVESRSSESVCYKQVQQKCI